MVDDCRALVARRHSGSARCVGDTVPEFGEEVLGNWRSSCYNVWEGATLSTTREGVFALTLTIDLAPETEARLRVQAQREGVETSELARRLIARGLPQLLEPESTMTGAQILAAWEQEDALGSFTDRPDSSEYARQLRHSAETRSDRR